MEEPVPEAIPNVTDAEAYKLWWSAQRKKYSQQRREKEQAILAKSVELLSQNREMSIEEKIILRKAEEIKARRLRMNEGSKRRHQKKRALDKAKEIEGINVKHSETNKRCEEKIKEVETSALESFKLQRAAQAREDRLKKREKEESILKNASELLSRNRELTSEEKEVLRIAEKVKADQLRKKAVTAEKQKLYRQLKREKDEVILKKARELLSQGQAKELSSEEKEILKQADDIKAYRLKNSQHTKQYNLLKREKALSPAEKEAQKLKAREYFQKKLEQRDSWRNDETGPLDAIKIENEVLQETTVKTIPTRQNADGDLVSKQEGSSCSRLKLEVKDFMTRRTSKSRKPHDQSYFRGASNHHNNNSYHSTQLDRRRTDLEESLRCMRVLMNVTTKADRHAVFGKQIAQKLRTSEKDVDEINIAKLLIDNVLQNLTIGVYNDDIKII